MVSVASDKRPVIAPVRYGFRSFDRQWIIPDNRLINRPNPTLWETHSAKQVYLTAPHDRTPSAGPALTFTGFIPDLHHYHGRGGRAFPLWSDAAGNQPNLQPGLLTKLSELWKISVTAEDVMAYLAAIAAHPAYVARFSSDLVQPGIRIPLRADVALFAEATKLGGQVIWLHTFGERFAAPQEQRPANAPRLPEGIGPRIPASGAIPSDADAMPDAISYDPAKPRLSIDSGYVDNVPPEVWAYQVSGKQVLTQWFSYRRRDRSRPIIGDRRPPSPLGNIQPRGWLAEYTTELLNLLHVLGRLVLLEPVQAELLEQICEGPLLPQNAIRMATMVSQVPSGPKRKGGKTPNKRQMKLLGEDS